MSVHVVLSRASRWAAGLAVVLAVSLSAGGGVAAGTREPQAGARSGDQGGGNPAGQAGQRGTREPQRQSQTPGLPPQWEWWNDAEFKKMAGLADDKAATIDRIFQSRLRLMRPWAEEAVQELAVLQRMTIERVASEDEYRLQAQRVETLFGRLRESRHVMLYRMYRELTPEQYKKLQDAQDARNRRRQSGRGAPPAR